MALDVQVIFPLTSMLSVLCITDCNLTKTRLKAASGGFWACFNAIPNLPEQIMKKELHRYIPQGYELIAKDERFGFEVYGQLTPRIVAICY
jgi:hypothetical protein